MLERLVKWWMDYVVTDTRPPIGPGDREALDLMYPSVRDEHMIEATPEDDVRAGLLFFDQNALAQHEAVLEQQKNAMKARIGDAAGIAGKGWKITWKQSSARKSTDYQKVAALLAEKLAEHLGHEAAARYHNAAREQAEVEKPGIRAFRTYPPKG